MKKIGLLLFVLALALMVVVSCTKEEETPTPTTGTISGTIAFQAGVSGDLNNSRVAIYASFDDWLNDRTIVFTAATGGAASSTYSMSNITPGTYYLDVWKDNDASLTWSTGDVVGVYGTLQYPSATLSPFMVSAGQTSTIDVLCIIAP